MQWLCEICGYVHEGDDAPESCLVCGAPASKFSKMEESQDAPDDDQGQD